MSARQEFASHHATFNHVWSSLLLEELFRLGVRDIALASGSRSAPLTMAAAAHPGFRRHLHFDERGLGFMALGLAKGSGRPVAVIMTSGTAVANLWPAVAEAQLTGVPLIILSADRPPELIDNGANQAIDQQGIFGRYPVYQQNLPSPTATIPAAFVLSSVDQALAQQARTPGPVHFNCMYPEPLYPGDAYLDYSAYLAPSATGSARPSPGAPGNWRRPPARVSQTGTSCRASAASSSPAAFRIPPRPRRSPRWPSGSAGHCWQICRASCASMAATWCTPISPCNTAAS